MADLSTDPAPPDELPPPSAVEPALSSLLAARASSPATVTLGTRGSQLALVQTHIVRDALERAHPKEAFAVSSMATAGDKNLSAPLYMLGAKALWTKELEVVLLEGAVDLVVHSLKDVPTSLPEGCELAAVMEREDPADVLVVKHGLAYKALDDLPDGSTVGTSSVRRVAQLKKAYPRLKFESVRGNLNTRLAKLDAADSPFSAIILAKAGLVRIDLSHRITSSITSPILRHAVGQGALGIEIRSNDDRMREMLRPLHHWQTAYRCQAEREMLRVLEGGCSVPVGVETTFAASGDGRGRLEVDAIVASLEGERTVLCRMEREVASEEEARALGREVALDLIRNGGKEILEELGRSVEREKLKSAPIPEDT